MNPIFELGVKKTLELDDLGVLPTKLTTRRLMPIFTNKWAEEKLLSDEEISLLRFTHLSIRSFLCMFLYFCAMRCLVVGSSTYVCRCLFRSVGFANVFYVIFCAFVNAVCGFGPVYILNSLVLYFDNQIQLSPGVLWLLVALLFVFPVLGAIAITQSSTMTHIISRQFSSMLLCSIYRKALVLSNTSRQTSSAGQIINMFSNDTMNVVQISFYIGLFVIAPLQIAFCLYFIYRQVNVATFVGLAFMCLTLPINALVFPKLTAVRNQYARATDERVKLMNEVLSGIRLIKYYG